MDFVKGLKEKKRMCLMYAECSDGCPLRQKATGLVCNSLMIEDPDKYAAIVEEWSEKNPEATLKSHFMELFPNAATGSDGKPVSCARGIYGFAATPDCIGGCTKCWNNPYKEIAEKNNENNEKEI